MYRYDGDASADYVAEQAAQHMRIPRRAVATSLRSHHTDNTTDSLETEDIPHFHANEDVPLHNTSDTNTSRQAGHESPSHRFFRPKRSKTERLAANIAARFSGGRALRRLHHVYNPKPTADTDAERHGLYFDHTQDDGLGSMSRDDKTGKYQYRNEMGKVADKYDDVAVYLSPTHAFPRRMVVQCTQDVLRDRPDQGDWIRTKMRGNVPLVLQLSKWALRPFAKRGWWNPLDGLIRVLLVALPLQAMLAMPVKPGAKTWKDDNVSDSYTEHRGYCWRWPKYATNKLDMAPNDESESGQMMTLDYTSRPTRPRNLTAKMNGEWTVVDGTIHDELQYIFISYARDQFHAGDRDKLHRMAEAIAEKAGLTAYWADLKPSSSNEAVIDEAVTGFDVYTMCDTIRSSSSVAIVLGNNTDEAKRGWGRRMWALPEALLASGSTVSVCYTDAVGTLQIIEVHKVELIAKFWRDSRDAMQGGDPTHLLAKHYSGQLTLSRLELLPAAIQALSTKLRDEYFTDSDLAYAVMGFLHLRIARNEDTLFQNLARLSLTYDSDRIVERMLSILPHPQPRQDAMRPDVARGSNFEDLIKADQYGTRLQHISPMCEVVGLTEEDETVIVEGCRAIHIRWKDFPAAEAKHSSSGVNTLAALFVTAGVWWTVQGCIIAIVYIPQLIDQNFEISLNVGIFITAFPFVGLFLFCAGPLAVRRMYDGSIKRSSPKLVGFEGVLPLRELETLIFGNCEGRLSYAPSSTPWIQKSRDARERRGLEPSWISNPSKCGELPQEVPLHHRLFTLVDMGQMQISIFSAETPPSVALICGKEGGMLRALLCSWRFADDCLFKETVIRMPTTVYAHAKQKEWLKLCLSSQGQYKRKKGAERQKARARGV